MAKRQLESSNRVDNFLSMEVPSKADLNMNGNNNNTCSRQRMVLELPKKGGINKRNGEHRPRTGVDLVVKKHQLYMQLCKQHNLDQKGGFLEFQAAHSSLCDSRSMDQGVNKLPSLTSMSQPCMPVSNIGPTRILPFLYLGSQIDALSQESTQMNGITYILNVSTTCPKPMYIQENHFLRIPVNDNYCDKLIPHFQEAFHYIDKVREANGCVLVHCLAGISRSPTLAIAFVMRHLNMSTDDAYKYVKDKRPTISPNFNFLGQLMEYEKLLKSEQDSPDMPHGTLKKKCLSDMRSPTSPKVLSPGGEKPHFLFGMHMTETPLSAQSPTTALAKLTFNQPSPGVTPTADKLASELPYPQLPTTSLDKLNFTACFTRDDALAAQPGGAAVKAKSVATKRPRNFGGSLESKTAENTQGSASQSNHSTNAAKTMQTQVTLRSPEVRAKRPTVRPNSIAFSTYPCFDLGSSESTPSPMQSATMESTCDNSNARTSDHLLTQAKNCLNNWETTQVNHNTSSGAVNQPDIQPKKSRSLEDILNSPNEDRKCGCVGVNRVFCHSKRMLTAADIYPPPMALDNVQSCRCRGTTDPHHQSSSSISSSGSHNSLHGSLEIIQVS